MKGRRSRRGIVAALVAALTALAVAGPLAAQEDSARIDTPYRWIERSLRIGLVGGYVLADRGVSELGAGSTVAGGARIRARISSPISLEGSVQYGGSDRFVVDPRLESGPAPVDTVSSGWLLVEAAMQFAITGARTWHGIQPYAVVGAGLLLGVDEETSPVFEESELADLRFDLGTTPVVQAGLGFEVKPADRWGIGFEARDHLWRISTPDGFFDSEVLDRIEELGLPAPRDTDWTHNLELSVGVWRYF